MGRAIDRDALADETQFHQGETRGYLTASIKERLSGDSWGEADGSTALAAAAGHAADVAIEFLLSAAGLRREHRWTYQLSSRADLYVGDHKVQTFGQSGPDVFVSRRLSKDDRDSPMWDPVVAIEVKRWSAHWNGHSEACPSGLHREYGAQMFCYPGGCWMKPISRSRVALRYVWLAPGNHIERFRDFDESLIPQKWADLELEYLDRVSRERLWRTARLECLEAVLRADPRCAGGALHGVVQGLLT